MTTRTLGWGLSFASVVALGGCIPFGWANPPGTGAIGGTARAFVAEPSAPAPEPGAPSPAPESGGLVLRAAVHPLGLLESQLDRDLDFFLGYGMEPALRLDTVHGPYAGAVWNVVHARLGERSVARVGVGGRTRLLMANDTGSGFGCSLGVSAELTGFVAGEFAEGESGGSSAVVIAGAALGEGGIGLFAEGGYAEVGPFAWMDVQAGVYLRVPMSGGFGIFCCLDLS